MAIDIRNLYKTLFFRTGPRSGTDIDMAEHGRAGGDSDKQGYKYTRGVDEKIIIDEADGTTTYFGYAKQGAATSASDWQIVRATLSGTTTTFEYADGDEDYDNEWDERANLSYS
jgi:hypothetical protein